MPEPKKQLILAILNILQKYTDEKHTLSQHKIQELLHSEYAMNADRKTVRRNLSKLMEFGFPVKHRGSDFDGDEITRRGRNGEDEQILTDWYYDRDLTDGELRLLINSVLFADGLSKTYRLDLAHKLERLSNVYFRSAVSKIDMEVYSRLENPEILLTIENIGSALSDGRQICFEYCDCGTDMKLRPRRAADGTPKRYTADPYQLVSKNGHTYLVCHLPPHENLSHFRTDRMKNCTVLKSAALPLRKIKGFGGGMLLSEYVKSHPELWSGETAHITFRCPQYLMNDVADSFGTDVRADPISDGMMEVRVKVGEADMLHWAVKYAESVEVLALERLRRQIAETLREALKKYDG